MVVLKQSPNFLSMRLVQLVNNIKVLYLPKSVFKKYLQDIIFHLVSSRYFLKSILQETFEKYLAQHWQDLVWSGDVRMSLCIYVCVCARVYLTIPALAAR